MRNYSLYPHILYLLIIFIIDTAFTTCTDGQSRLVNGTLAQEGRVEVCLSGIWGSVCQNGFGQSDAYVICKELGYNGPCKLIINTINCYYYFFLNIPLLLFACITRGR